MGCGCGKKNKRRATAGTARTSVAGYEPPTRVKVSWVSNPPVGVFEEPQTFSTLFDCRSWARSHPGWSIETVKTPIPT